MFGLTRGLSGWPIQWNHSKCCGADHCCYGNEIWARLGDPVAYRLVYHFRLLFYRIDYGRLNALNSVRIQIRGIRDSVSIHHCRQSGPVVAAPATATVAASAAAKVSSSSRASQIQPRSLRQHSLRETRRSASSIRRGHCGRRRGSILCYFTFIYINSLTSFFAGIL